MQDEVEWVGTECVCMGGGRGDGREGRMKLGDESFCFESTLN